MNWHGTCNCVGSIRTRRDFKRNLPTMSSFTHIIVKWHADRWSAWFVDAPFNAVDGITSILAIQGLMQVHGLSDLGLVQRVTVDDGTTNGQTEIRSRSLGV